MSTLDNQKGVETTKEAGNKAGIIKTAIIGAALLSTQVRANDLLQQCDLNRDGIVNYLKGGKTIKEGYTRKEIFGLPENEKTNIINENNCEIKYEREQRTKEREQRTKEREQRTKEREKWKQRFDMTLALLPENEAKKFLEDKIKNLDIKIKKEANNKIKDRLTLERKILQERLDKLNKKIV